MKKLIYCLFFVISSKTYSQVTPGNIDRCNYLQSFAGEWMYSTGSDTIRIYLRYHESQFGTYSIEPEILGSLWGWHEYKRGDSVIQSNYQNRLINLPPVFIDISADKYSIILSMPECDPNKDKLMGTIIDYHVANQLMNVTVKFDMNTLNILYWHQERSSAFSLITDARGMTLPPNFILIKQ